MTDERWPRVKALFQAAVERPTEERDAFLAAATGDDEALRREVESLLTSDTSDASFLYQLPVASESVLADLLVAPLASMDHTRSHTVLTSGLRVGPYEIIAALGAGGMGEVYRAHDTRLSRDVAIKVLPRTFTENPGRLTRFRREARVLASLNHPNIAAIYGLEKSRDVDHLILELVEGEILIGPLPIDTALDYAGQIAAALEAAHGKGIIHRDLKPANVKVTPEGRVKLLDFGLAKAVRDIEQSLDRPRQLTTGTGLATVAGDIVGSPSYMSPEQARGQHVDERTDIWAFGCLLYELLTGRRAFPGEVLSDTIEGVLEREPDYEALPDGTPVRIRQLLRRCLDKDAARRLENIADARRTIEQSRRGWNRWQVAAIAAAALGTLVIGGPVWSRGPARTPKPSEWVQITKLPDSVSQPALSPDGRSVTFIRGPATFFGPGEVYVKRLPDGEPLRLTHDNFAKMSPVFSSDGRRIAYTVVGQNFEWDTWVVPVLGGEPQRWLRNASGLVWSGPRHVLFSEIKNIPHMAIVAAEESGTGAHDVYLPAHEHAMAHRSYPSPDGKWVLIVEMDMDHAWMPCRLLPMDGSSSGRQVGPSGGGCTSGAWSPDGQWMYVTSNAGGVHHIWRQRFPDGQPEQVTSGPTEEQGIAMAPDGRSFVTAMALQNLSIWLHDARGERQISSLEGIAANPKFTADGKKLCYTLVKEAPTPYSPQPGEVWVADVESGRSESLVPGFRALDYDVSPDGQQVVMEATDAERKHRLWLVPFDHHSPPRQIPNVEGRQPRFGPSGEIFFRRAEENSNFVYRIRPDGSGMRKVIEQAIPLLFGVSHDGRWVVGWARLPDNDGMAVQAFSLSGAPAMPLGDFIGWNWSAGGGAVSISDGPIAANRSYIIPLPPGEPLPRTPTGGFRSEEEISDIPGARRIDAWTVPGPSLGIYAFYRGTTQRNLYRIPIR